ncbi:hypothetical protein DTO027B5_4073 [Paecilomyces variotii]|nr:hypothetical protein DTO169C6_3398 [Paecilomyces variotii]KAJ9284910.1 hypothetical protein DTO021C3_7543 [Paecilomyces variotii]KAJ9323321.1 hypothetical protein DTO027B3_5671 [Paecilomyces variotii]KAJ9334165.1 hypothetical protein DTO027B5_4073 [Paecilomyces variotii]KAJ9394794.1 hypothetical protein DTO282F9_8268 [Paecilomyces variotii]
MPPLPGEERMLTLFADIHSYFAAPTAKPLHHRFDKGSYLYIYHDAARRTTRIEIANNPGTPEQDAFNGALDHVRLQHSTKFPTRCTLIVDGNAPGQTPSANANPLEWRLPSADPRDEGKVVFRLHTLDIYLWTVDDANLFLDTLEHVLSPGQVETDRHPPLSTSQGAISSVVQQLENVAITDPAYANGQTRNSRTEPPPMPQPGSQPAAEQPKEQTGNSNYAPLAYNPAAPAAPEPIQHREKTPPPEDGVEGTGLAAAAAADHGHPYASPPLSAGYATPPSHQVPYTVPGAMQPSYSSPPPSAGPSLESFPSHSSVQTPTRAPSFSGPPVTGNIVAGQGTMSFAPPPLAPNSLSYSQHPYAPQSLYHHHNQPQYADYLQNQSVPSSLPLGGYSNFSYEQPHQHHGDRSEYDVHSQVYRPTEAEASSRNYKHSVKALKNPGRPHKLEDKAARLESGVNRFIKKLEKKI